MNRPADTQAAEEEALACIASAEHEAIRLIELDQAGAADECLRAADREAQEIRSRAAAAGNLDASRILCIDAVALNRLRRLLKRRLSIAAVRRMLEHLQLTRRRAA